MVERQAEERVARFEQRHVGGVVGLGAGVRPGRWRARRRTAPWRGRSPAARRRRPPRSRRSSGGRGSPRRTCWSAPSRPRRAPPAGTKFSEAIISSVPCWRRSSPRARRRSRDRPRPAARSGSSRAARSSVRATIATGRDSLRPVRAARPSRPRARSAACLALAAGAAAAASRTPATAREARAPALPQPADRAADRALRPDTAGGRVLLRATSDVRSRGRGPMELRGTRNGWRTMRVNQRIYRAGGGHIDVPTDATLHFTDVGAYFGGSYWKVHQLARFELLAGRRPTHRSAPACGSAPSSTTACATSSAPGPGTRSPRHRHYPGCNQNPYQRPRSPSAPRSAGRTSTPPTTTSSGSTSPACAAASPS